MPFDRLAAFNAGVEPWTVSFKGALQTLDKMLPLLDTKAPIDAWCDTLLEGIARAPAIRANPEFSASCRVRALIVNWPASILVVVSALFWSAPAMSRSGVRTSPGEQKRTRGPFDRARALEVVEVRRGEARARS
jgi:hypothetical protein